MKMRTKKYYILYMLAILLGGAACNDEWTEEQYEQFIAFKAPLDDNGVTPIYVRYRADSVTSYKLPIIVSGSLTNERDITVNVAVDPDTLNVLNHERFQSRTDLYYEELDAKFFSMPDNVKINAGKDVSLINIDFSLSDIDLVDKWVLPLTVVNDPTGTYTPTSAKKL